ncbi:MAG TPA: hypothetical protein VF524_12020, partial [Polyangia bacterium]
MSKLVVHVGACALIATALFFACSGKGAHSAENAPSASSLPPARAASEPALPALDEAGPSLNLLTSSALWHPYEQGLVISFAGEGFRKYSQEYTNPWRGTSKLDDHVGRTLGSTAATLHFPWNADTGEASILVRVHGGSAGKKLSVRLNGKPIKNATLESGWQQRVLPVPSRVLTSGENTLMLAAGKRGAVF